MALYPMTPEVIDDLQWLFVWCNIRTCNQNIW